MRRWTRRGWFGRVAAGLAAAGALDGGCAARPAAAGRVLVVAFQLYVVGVPNDATTVNLVQEFVDQAFNARHRGVRALWQFANGPPGATVTAVLAGAATAPLLLAHAGSVWPQYQPLLAPLDGKLRAAGVPGHTWAPGQLAAFRVGGKLYALPNNAASEAYLYRQDILDELGMRYPQPGWTYQDAQRLWRRCSGAMPGGGHRYGCTVPFGPGTALNPVPEGLAAVVHGFGGAYRDAGHTRCLLDLPGSIRCGQYFLDLVWEQAATSGDGYPNPGIFDGSVVFTQGAEPTIIEAVQRLGTQAKWDFIPHPTFPVRRVGILHDNFYGINALSPHQDLAFELLRFAAIDAVWTRFYMRQALAPPGQVGLLEEWLAVLRSVAPPLRSKNLEAWTQPTIDGLGRYDYEFFHYQPQNVAGVFARQWPALWSHQVGVTAGFRAIADEINALEAAGRGKPPVTVAELQAAALRERRRTEGMFAAAATGSGT